MIDGADFACHSPQLLQSQHTIQRPRTMFEQHSPPYRLLVTYDHEIFVLFAVVVCHWFGSPSLAHVSYMLCANTRERWRWSVLP